MRHRKPGFLCSKMPRERPHRRVKMLKKRVEETEGQFRATRKRRGGFYVRIPTSTLSVIWQWSATLYCTSSFLVFLFFLSCEYNFFPSCILHSFATAPCHHIVTSSKNEDISPLAALAPLHSLAHFVSSTSPATGSTGSGREDREKYIQLTSHKPDTWLVYVGRLYGRWWKGA
jgi:hypothetical protein